MAQICSAYVTLNTEKNTKWSVKVFSEWRSARIKKGCDKDSATGDCPINLLENPVISDLNFWISRFVAEVRPSFLTCSSNIRTGFKPATGGCNQNNDEY